MSWRDNQRHDQLFGGPGDRLTGCDIYLLLFPGAIVAGLIIAYVKDFLVWWWN